MKRVQIPPGPGPSPERSHPPLIQLTPPASGGVFVAGEEKGQRLKTGALLRAVRVSNPCGDSVSTASWEVSRKLFDFL